MLVYEQLTATTNWLSLSILTLHGTEYNIYHAYYTYNTYATYNLLQYLQYLQSAECTN